MSRRAGALLLSAGLLSACNDGVIHAFEPQAAGAGPIDTTLPGVVDDFEDGDTRANAPLGWWYPINDGTSTQGFGIEPLSGDTGSVYALRTHGSGFRDWGAAVGVNLIGDSIPLSAAAYTELCFVARVDAGSTPLVAVHLIRDDNHYTQEISLSDAWSNHCLRLTGFIRADDGPLVPSELVALQFFFAPETAFAFWLDEVTFQKR